MKKITDKYAYRVEWSEDDQTHIATCLEMPTLKAHGKTVESAVSAVKRAVNATLKWMKQENKTLPEPFSVKPFRGKLVLRTTPDVHRMIAVQAAEKGVSINQYILSRVMG